jgi:hypothetical protein
MTEEMLAKLSVSNCRYEDFELVEMYVYVTAVHAPRMHEG